MAVDWEVVPATGIRGGWTLVVMFRKFLSAAQWCAWVVSALLVLRIVLPWHDLQDHAHWGKVQWIPFVSPPIKMIDIVGNVLLYMPFGYFGGTTAGRRWSPWMVLACAAALSLSTESVQLFSHRRYPSTTDVLCNVTGCLAGLCVALPAARRSSLILSEEIRS